MIAGFQGNEHRRTERASVSGRRYRDGFGMRLSIRLRRAFSNDDAIRNDHRPDRWIGTGPSKRSSCQRQCAGHEGAGNHGAMSPSGHGSRVAIVSMVSLPRDMVRVTRSPGRYVRSR